MSPCCKPPLPLSRTANQPSPSATNSSRRTCRGKGADAAAALVDPAPKPAALQPAAKNRGPKSNGPQILGLDLTPELTAIILVYLVQGILGLSRLAVSFYFKDDLGMDPAELAVFTGFSTLPWLIKPLYGFASDTFPLFGYRRRSYLVLCGLLGSAAWSAMFALKPAALLATVLLVLGSAGTACSDVVVDSIVVEASRGKPGSVAGARSALSVVATMQRLHAPALCAATRNASVWRASGASVVPQAQPGGKAARGCTRARWNRRLQRKDLVRNTQL